MRFVVIMLALMWCAFPALAEPGRPGQEVGEAAYYYARTLLAEKKEAAEAERWLRTAIRLGEGRAALVLAQLIEDGRVESAPATRKTTVADLRALGLALRKSLAERGNIKVATEIGLTYLYGRGIEASPKKAQRWIERAAKGGEPRALLELSRMVRYGAAVGHTPQESIPLLEQSAAKRFATSVRELAEMHGTGMLTPLDAQRSLKYYLQGASYGNAESMRRAGLAYLSGFGTKQDSAKAVEFLERAAASGNAVAMFNLAMLYRYPPQDMMADKAAFLRWLEKAAELEQADALYLLGKAYEEGDGVTKNAAEAKRLMGAAAVQGYFPAEVVQGE